MSDTNSNSEGLVALTSKRKQKSGRLSDAKRTMNLQSHETGDDCNCKRYRCFQTTSQSQRQRILNTFNSFKTHNEQNLYLTGLISAFGVEKHRPRKPGSKIRHEASFQYRVKVLVTVETASDTEVTSLEEVPVCAKAFMAIHGIGKGKLDYIKNSIKSTGKAPVDKRGSKTTLHRKLDDQKNIKVMEHIDSFKRLTDGTLMYLSEELSVRKMHNIYKEAFPDYPVSYDTYNNIFKNRFNITFGYPSCSTHGANEAKINPVKKRQLNLEHVVETFYDRKKKSQMTATKSD